MYRLQCWLLRNIEKDLLLIFEKYYDRYTDLTLIRVLKNGEKDNWGVYYLFKQPDIVYEMKWSKSEWVGLVLREQREQEPKVNNVLQENLRGKRSVGRPRLHWKD